MRSPVTKTALAWAGRYLALGVAVSLFVPFMRRDSPSTSYVLIAPLVGAIVGAAAGGLGGAYYGWVKATAGKRRVERGPFDDLDNPADPSAAKGSTPDESTPPYRKRRLVLAAAVIVAILLIGHWSWRTQVQPRQLVSLSIELGDEDRWDEAVTVLRRAIQLRPDDAEINFRLGMALFKQQHLDEAVVVLRRAIQLQPDNAEAHFRLGMALFKQHQSRILEQLMRRGRPEPGGLEEVIAEYREAFRLRPDLTSAARELGKALSRQGRHEEALAVFEQVLRGDEIRESDYENRYDAVHALTSQKAAAAHPPRSNSAPP
ncbi:MAG: tetratricopeptide repeat protein [Isosphaeraceae bacterium]